MAHLIRAYRGGDSRKLAGWWFAWVEDRHSDDFRETVERIKQAPADMREWNEERREWWYAIELETELERIFPAFSQYRHQMEMFADG